MFATHNSETENLVALVTGKDRCLSMNNDAWFMPFILKRSMDVAIQEKSVAES